MRTAVLIMAHTDPGHLGRLCGALLRHASAGEPVDIYVHLDAKADIREFGPVDGVTFLKRRYNVRWGGFSMIEAVLCSLEEIYVSGPKFDYLHLISGQDYPLLPVPGINRRLGERPGTIYMAGHRLDDADPVDRRTRRRYERYHFFTHNRALWRVTFAVVNLLMPCKRRIPGVGEVYKGALWFSLPRDCVGYILDYCKCNPRYINAFRATSCTDEIFFHTIVMNSPLAGRVVNDYHRFIRWREGNPNPEWLTVEDFDAVAASGCWFARKFGRGGEELCDAIDCELLSSGD